MSIPLEKMSTEAVSLALPPVRAMSCSGACQPGLPPAPSVSKLAWLSTSFLLSPMSDSLARPDEFSSTLCGLRSRCTMPRE